MKLVIVQSNSWDGLFADGQNVHEEHTIYIGEGLEYLRTKFGMPLNIESFAIVNADEDWFENQSNYPEKLEDVKLEA